MLLVEVRRGVEMKYLTKVWKVNTGRIKLTVPNHILGDHQRIDVKNRKNLIRMCK